MNGPEHHREAELALERARTNAEIGDREDATYWVAEAQVHATLALAAVHANTKAIAEFPLAHQPDGYDDPDGTLTWSEVIR